MFHHEIEPRFNDTDALGHISNTAFPAWFEQAQPIPDEIRTRLEEHQAEV